MYGLVNQAVRDLVIKVAGEGGWQEIRRKAGVEVDTFVAMESYPDALTYSLVGAASQALAMDPAAVLRAFGKHWIQYTAAEGYGALMDMFGEDYFEALANINQLHARIGLTMPHLSAPTFKIRQESADQCYIEYISSRKGLAPMMLGLLEGLAEKHHVKVNIEHVTPGVRSQYDLFIVTRVT